MAKENLILLPLLDVKDQIVTNPKHHYIELLEDRFIFSASFIADELIESEWRNGVRREWHDVHLKSDIVGWSRSTALYGDDSTRMFKFSIQLQGADDVIVLFEYDDDGEEEWKNAFKKFDNWMNQKIKTTI